MRANIIIIILMYVMSPTTSISFAKRLDNIRLSHFSHKREIIDSDEYATVFEKYDKAKNLKERKERLDAFALYLQENPHFQGYIISYGGRRACIGEAQARGEDAKTYLVKVKGIKATRLVVLNGGYYEEWAVELWAGVRGAPAPTPMPVVDSNEVRIIRNCKAWNNYRRLSPPRRKQRPLYH